MVKNMNRDKAPGLDGFLLAFFQLLLVDIKGGYYADFSSSL